MSLLRSSGVSFSAGLVTPGNKTRLDCIVKMPHLYSFDERRQADQYG